MHTSAKHLEYVLITTDDSLKFFTRDASRAKEVPNTFLNSSVDRRLPPSTSGAAPDQAITADHVSMKISSEIYLEIRKPVLHFGSYPLSADLRQCVTV